ncbi:hypothetical protein [Methylobacterium gossipiicola]|uniref:Uncharacterized protein n=1 Tax=Methylobacterium gossipiicola TaxID=582675 RepID=A0A1I2TC76_9HYPH|nr:hypothetical protein [Methylobacterium gossipiicola]SFG60907.1 hypothetical protein SAMN05192565_106173 [Methylobacterium gossipiicola]
MLVDDPRIELEGVDGVLVYGDSAAPDRFYYAGTRPRLARDGDGYLFTLIRYERVLDGRAGAPPQAGMLSFVVDLAPAPADLAAAETALRKRRPDARLTPIPWTSGTVIAAIIGGDPVRATPSLMGDNSAVVSLGLTTDQYLLLTRSLDDPDSVPISVVYDLQFEVLRPSFAYAIQFDLTRYRLWVRKTCTANVLFVSFESVETFEDLRQSGAITIHSTVSTDEPVPDGVRRAFLRSLQTLMTPLPAFAAPPAGGSPSWGIGYSCETIRDTQAISRTLDCDLQVSDAVTRTVHLQGALADLSDALRSRPVIQLPTGVTFVQDLTLRCHAVFDGAPLEAVQVSLEPAAGLSGHVFNADRTEDWRIALTHAPAQVHTYACRCDVRFGNGRPAATGRLSLARDQAFVDLQPATLYTFRRYAVTVAPDFPWSLVPSVTVALDGPPALSFTPGSLVLTGGRPSGTIEVFAPSRQDLDGVTVRARYGMADGGARTRQSLPSGATIFLNPLRKRTVVFAAAPDTDWQRWSAIRLKLVKGARFQAWAPQQLELTRREPRARFTHWFADERELTCETLFRSANASVPGAVLRSHEHTIVVPSRPDSEVPDPSRQEATA